MANKLLVKEGNDLIIGDADDVIKYSKLKQEFTIKCKLIALAKSLISPLTVLFPKDKDK